MVAPLGRQWLGRVDLIGDGLCFDQPLGGDLGVLLSEFAADGAAAGQDGGDKEEGAR